MKHIFVTAFLTISMLLPFKALAVDTAKLEQELQNFNTDTNTYMNTVRMKRLPDGRVVNKIETLFPAMSLFDGHYVDLRLQDRSKYKWYHRGGKFSAPSSNDRAEQLVDNGNTMLRSLAEMDKYKDGKLDVVPWADYYWPIYLGSLSYRYADMSFPDSASWKENRDYVLKKTAASVLEGTNEAEKELLAPAEKFDALLGSKTSLTDYNWGVGQQYFDETGKVERWMGICHGWAPASFMVPKPQKLVTLKSADGKNDLKFFPDDIEALASSLWAEGSAPTKFIGGRCNEKDPKKDANGRILDPNCMDTNPATWHEAVVNQIGVSKRGFVIDATFDYEVWNQPVYSYSYSYFNPQSFKAASTLDEAKVALSSFRADKFKQYRAPNAKFVVGIAMDLTYVVEHFPQHQNLAEENETLRTVQYQYDLELDSKGTIIGGEWYTNQHPDFLWVPEKGSMAQTAYESGATSTWANGAELPADWKDAGLKASQGGAPLGKIVEELVQRSRE